MVSSGGAVYRHFKNTQSTVGNVYEKFRSVPELLSTAKPRLCAVAMAAALHSCMASIEMPLREVKVAPVMVAWLQFSITSV